ncbi:MAG: membrane protein insertion efficiency factor YidD [Actinomycetota bacterium]|nr:membrane protein insertion efficiency factor YidD [Actinomycetota bacterium]
MTKSNITFRLHSHEHAHSEHSRSAQVLLLLLSWYQKARAGRIAPCRFYPSCSNYAYEAVRVHGALRGSGLALRRISKCRPLGPHGIDLVPEEKKDRSATS